MSCPSGQCPPQPLHKRSRAIKVFECPGKRNSRHPAVSERSELPCKLPRVLPTAGSSEDKLSAFRTGATNQHVEAVVCFSTHVPCSLFMSVVNAGQRGQLHRMD
eukprot:scaffold91009_cov49-Prasinocladus_malaysianus.AAC.2